MDVPAFATSPIGQLVPISGYDARHQADYAHFAFVPEPLPQEVQLTGETWNVVSRAMNSLGRLDQAGRQLPNPQMFRRSSIRREAVSTSALEGTHAAFTDVLEADVSTGASRSPEVTEVLNYVRAAEHAFESVRDRGLTLGLLLELQAILVKSTASSSAADGRIRNHQVVIGPDHCTVEESRFVPPPPGDHLVGGTNDWEKWISSDHALPAVVQTALAHYQFETLHPFADGNGRIGRLVVVLQLMTLGELSEPLLTVSPHLEARRSQYTDGLLAVSRTGDFDPWVRFFAGAVQASADQTVEKVGQLLEFQDAIRTRIREEPIRGVAAQIAEDLIGQPITTPTYASERYSVTYPAANSAVAKLTSLGILTELTGRAYGRVFAAKDVLRIIDRPRSSNG
jgi:Fic family protein